MSSELPLTEAAIPRRLIFPLLQRGGRDAEPLVSVGDPVLKGQVIARSDDPLTPPIHASSSGVVAEVNDRPLPHPSGLAGRCIVIETDGADASVPLPPMVDFRSFPVESLRARIHEAGVVGLGGAGFSTAAKIDPARGIDTLILNGAECEPYISCDDSLMRHFPEHVLEGAKILLHLLGIERCLLGIEDDMPEAISAVREVRRRSDDSAIEIIPVPAIYPAGSERLLIRTLTGKQVPARGFPSDIGVVCQNVATAAAVFRAVVHGEVLTSRIVTVTGRGVRSPRNLSVRIGTPIADLIGQCGGYTNDAERLILGGPMMGYTLPSDEVPITRTTNCILVTAREELPGKGDSLPCIRCGACAEVCPVELLPQQLHWYARARDFRRVEDYRLFDCIECGCCDIVCPSHIPLAQHFRAAKSEVTVRQREREQAEQARIRFEARQTRKAHEHQQRADDAIRRKAALNKPGATEIAAAIERAKARKEAARSGPDPKKLTSHRNGIAPTAEPDDEASGN